MYFLCLRGSGFQKNGEENQLSVDSFIISKGSFSYSEYSAKNKNT